MAGTDPVAPPPLRDPGGGVPARRPLLILRT